MPNTTEPVTEVTADAETIRSQHLDWIFTFDRARGSGHWDLEAELGRFYDWDVETRLYDDMDPEHRTARSAEEYRAMWEPVFNAVEFGEHRIAEGPDVRVSGDMATSWLVFIAYLEVADGTVVRLRSNNFLEWERFPDGWKIVRDHTSSQHISEEQIRPLLAELPARGDL
jgi:ketosteroid isomerase-like protein